MLIILKGIASFLFYLFLCILWICMIVCSSVIVLFIANTTYYDLTGIDIARELAKNAKEKRLRSQENRSNCGKKN